MSAESPSLFEARDVTMAATRWRSSHSWRRNSNFVYDTYPQMYDWVCARCEAREVATRPSRGECPGLAVAE